MQGNRRNRCNETLKKALVKLLISIKLIEMGVKLVTESFERFCLRNKFQLEVAMILFTPSDHRLFLVHIVKYDNIINMFFPV